LRRRGEQRDDCVVRELRRPLRWSRLRERVALESIARESCVGVVESCLSQVPASCREKVDLRVRRRGCSVELRPQGAGRAVGSVGFVDSRRECRSFQRRVESGRKIRQSQSGCGRRERGPFVDSVAGSEVRSLIPSQGARSFVDSVAGSEVVRRFPSREVGGLKRRVARGRKGCALREVGRCVCRGLKRRVASGRRVVHCGKSGVACVAG
jgi:hypothetical protein